MKLLSCRRAPDAKRGCPPATAVAGASSPSIPEAGAAPRHLSSGGQVGGGCLGAICPIKLSNLQIAMGCLALHSAHGAAAPPCAESRASRALEN